MYPYLFQFSKTLVCKMSIGIVVEKKFLAADRVKDNITIPQNDNNEYVCVYFVIFIIIYILLMEPLDLVLQSRRNDKIKERK